MTRRRLRQDELELWRKVTRKAEKLDLGNLIGTGDPVRAGIAASQSREPKTFTPLSKPELSSAPARHDLAPSVRDAVRQSPVRMDRRAFEKMKRGKTSPEARIDLHGMTADRAHGALSRFILSSQAKGKRLVLVITGKGKDRDEGGPIPTRYGVLRHQVPQWLSLPPLAGAVLQVSEAHRRHGGGGAYYVYLRKTR